MQVPSLASVVVDVVVFADRKKSDQGFHVAVFLFFSLEAWRQRTLILCWRTLCFSLTVRIEKTWIFFLWVGVCESVCVFGCEGWWFAVVWHDLSLAIVQRCTLARAVKWYINSGTLFPGKQPWCQITKQPLFCLVGSKDKQTPRLSSSNDSSTDRWGSPLDRHCYEWRFSDYWLRFCY